MPEYRFPYLIVGGGMAADAAVAGIREIDASGGVAIATADVDPPYNRPPLSKGLWKDMPFEQVWRRAAREARGVTLLLNHTIRGLDPAAHRAVDDGGNEYVYDRVLLATGGTPRRLPFGGDRVIYFRTLEDYRRLRALAGERERFGVIGGGFIGSEIAAALTMHGRRVTLFLQEPGIGARLFPADLAGFLNDYYRERGVEVAAGEPVTGLEVAGERTSLVTRSGRRHEVDGVVAGLGIQPNVDLAAAAGLSVDDGIVVDAGLQTSARDVYAAGDVASFFAPALERRLRVEHEDNANAMGRAAGRAMAGAAVTYDYLPFFYSDLFELGYEAVGLVDSRLQTVADWREPYREGVVYYLEDERVRGVLLWNTWGQVDAARALIAERGPHRPDTLRGRLPA